mmetsp:Transcript_17517/g.36763  ORF Transcript_17517/g.36763 Transcript_17517/m.36763 type:complete len:122 (+) Transcript_17517:84-449(+)
MSLKQNNDDLYGDLDGILAKPSSFSPVLREKVSPSGTTPISFSQSTDNTKPSTPRLSSSNPAFLVPQSEVNEMQQQMMTLKEENEILKKNMGILYRTAKSELERKDRAIERLQNELDTLRR